MGGALDAEYASLNSRHHYSFAPLHPTPRICRGQIRWRQRYGVRSNVDVRPRLIWNPAYECPLTHLCAQYSYAQALFRLLNRPQIRSDCANSHRVTRSSSLINSHSPQTPPLHTCISLARRTLTEVRAVGLLAFRAMWLWATVITGAESTKMRPHSRARNFDQIEWPRSGSRVRPEKVGTVFRASDARAPVATRGNGRISCTADSYAVGRSKRLRPSK